MTVAAIAPKHTVVVPKGVDEKSKSALPGVIAGVAVTGGITALGMTRGALPLPLALTLGAAVGGPIIGISLMNSDGKPNKAWQSALVGAAPFAVAGGGLGAMSSMMANKSSELKMIGGGIAGAIMIGAVGAGLGAVTHALTKPKG